MKSRRFFPHARHVGHLSRQREGAVHVLLGGAWLTGLAWLVVRYGFRPVTEFGELPHPSEAWWLRFHGAFAFGVVWLSGLLWAVHVRAAWRSQRRISGIVLGGLLVVLIASGYLLYYVGDEGLRATISAAHWVVGVSLIVPWLFHAFARRWRRRREERHSRRSS